jgi:hypothetical protein
MSAAKLDDFIARIRARRPRMLFGYPSSISMIARHAVERGIRVDDLGIEVAFVTESLSLALAIDALDGACTPTTRLAHVQVPGDLTRVRAIAQGSPDGPLALLVVTTSVEDERTPGTERWSLFPPGARTAGWSAELPSGAALAADQRVRVTIDDTSHLQIRWPDGREGSARWDGTQILLSPPGIDLAAAGLGTAGGTAQAIEGAAADPNENATP